MVTQCTMMARGVALRQPVPTRVRQRRGTLRRSRSSRASVPRAGVFGLGAPELAVVVGVGALLFGPSKLPELGRSVGKSVRGFQVRLTNALGWAYSFVIIIIV